MNDHRPYRIELEGFNDGHTYQQGSYSIISNARKSLENFRKSNPKVRYRLIEVKEDFS